MVPVLLLPARAGANKLAFATLPVRAEANMTSVATLPVVQRAAVAATFLRAGHSSANSLGDHAADSSLRDSAVQFAGQLQLALSPEQLLPAMKPQADSALRRQVPYSPVEYAKDVLCPTDPNHHWSEQSFLRFHHGCPALDQELQERQWYW